MPQPDTTRLFTTRAVPLRYLVIPKCGCTLIKNLLWRLDHGADHPLPLRVHDDDSRFLRADALGLTPADIRAEQHAFTVLRNPVDRVFSLYTDKVIGPGWRRFVPLREILVKRHGLNPQPESVAAHQENCAILIDWLARNLSEGADLPHDAHWTPQAWRWPLIEGFDLHLLTLNGIEAQLAALAGDLVPGLGDILSGLETNRSSKPVQKGAVLVPALRQRINRVYAADRRLFVAVRDAWAARGPGNTAPTALPRARDFAGMAA